MTKPRFTLIRKNEVPSGGFRYTQSETGIVLHGACWTDLLDAVKKHRKANMLPVGIDLEGEIEQQLCEILPPGWCDYDGQPNQPWNRKGMTFEEVLMGTGTLLDWFLRGKKKVEKSEAERRGNICAKCQFNQTIEGCSTCKGGSLQNLVNAIVGGEQTIADNFLKACTFCGCSNRAQIWMPLDILQAHVKKDIDEALPEWCWKKKPVIS